MTTAAPTVGVLSLQGDVAEHVRMLEHLGARTVRVRRPEELARVDALVLPGGESTTIEKLLRAFDLVEPLQDALRAGLPTLGTCAGMILLADEILDAAPGQRGVGGIDMVVRRNAFGRQVDSFEMSLAAPGLLPDVDSDDADRPLRAVFIRAPWAESVGDGVEVLATVAVDDGGDHGEAVERIVAVRQGSLIATAFHPETTSEPFVHRLLLNSLS
ncbi:pyridoxal 5'-phosphate synthase glutaminase subunit PdxT [Serinibacter arcticus]|uniref:Pyridoxal 5'-phosphate synthase subunit PdxT n=1 Tax=Serinibacter arcticus TaxID=1655435 RepID=A0A4Z1E709_9MICO|nr:pyridoxal 5'-phosphate synthase glutaminase subunit PdxT [Serinibacter arcticus]TGO05371.1 Pyridoxine biosynthesis glutamine amidotransferase, glutaminase subunit [Serinibacter arcticus]